MEKMVEILAPAGDMEKLKTALYFGADAVYLSGKKFGLRAFSGNFTEEELIDAVNLVHSQNKKVYVTINILAHNSDFEGLKEYLEFLNSIHVDGVIVSDLGVAGFVKKYAKDVELHVSTQASITNKYSAMHWIKLGAKRLVLARELSLKDIREIREFIPKEIELECFVHGAMCISYSGRCLLSNFMTGRDSNRGACVQACRWEYEINEVKRKGQNFPILEDGKGTYILNSKDMCLINHIKELIDAGINSFKIEGRMKSPYYVATVVNAYKKAVADALNENNTNINYSVNNNIVDNDSISQLNSVKLDQISNENDTKYHICDCVDNKSQNECVVNDNISQKNKNMCICSNDNSCKKMVKTDWVKEVQKTSHRQFTTGFYFEGENKEYFESSLPVQDSEFIAMVLSDTNKEGFILIEQRNRFVVGDTLEILSPTENFNKTFVVEEMKNELGETITVADQVQQKLYLKTPYKLNANDILRRDKC